MHLMPGTAYRVRLIPCDPVTPTRSFKPLVVEGVTPGSWNQAAFGTGSQGLGVAITLAALEV